MGGREIGYLFGQYKRLRDEFTGVLTGKGISYGGSLSVIKDWQKRMTSASLFPLGSKSLPPLPPPIGRVVKSIMTETCRGRYNGQDYPRGQEESGVAETESSMEGVW